MSKPSVLITEVSQWRARLKRMADHFTASQHIVAPDSDGRLWLYLNLLDHHNEHVVFIGHDGTRRLDLVNTFDVFEWQGVVYEVQGHDRKNRRCWLEPVKPVDEKPAGNPADPRGRDDRPDWSKGAA